MTTEPPEQQPGDPGDPGGSEPEPHTPERVRTGVERVDEVIRAVEELEDRPIEEHVGVFESAQVQLRRALDDHPTNSDPGEPDGPDGPDGPDDHPGHT